MLASRIGGVLHDVAQFVFNGIGIFLKFERQLR